MTTVTLLCTAPLLPEETEEYFGKCQIIITLNGDFLDLTYSIVLCKKKVCTSITSSQKPAHYCPPKWLGQTAPFQCL